MSRLQQLLNLYQASPNEPFICFALAKEYEKLGEEAQALHFYTTLVEKHPDYVGTYYHLGKLYEKMQDAPKAFFTYKQGMQVARKIGDGHALSELAGAKLNLGDDEDFED